MHTMKRGLNILMVLMLKVFSINFLTAQSLTKIVYFPAAFLSKAEQSSALFNSYLLYSLLASFATHTSDQSVASIGISFQSLLNRNSLFIRTFCITSMLTGTQSVIFFLKALRLIWFELSPCIKSDMELPSETLSIFMVHISIGNRYSPQKTLFFVYTSMTVCHNIRLYIAGRNKYRYATWKYLVVRLAEIDSELSEVVGDGKCQHP